MPKTASLTAGLVAKKGGASPATVAPAPHNQDVEKPGTPTGPYYKSLTVKLDRARYESLKSAGLMLDKKSQEIFVEALDLWLKAPPQHRL